MMLGCWSAVRIADGADVGALLTKALARSEMSHKEACLTCGIDGAAFSRSLHGEAPLDLWKLRLLPVRFWREFLPMLASALIQRWMDDLCEPLRMAKADLRKHEDTNRRAS